MSYTDTRQTSDLRIELIEQLEELNLTPCELICNFNLLQQQFVKNLIDDRKLRIS